MNLGSSTLWNRISRGPTGGGGGDSQYGPVHLGGGGGEDSQYRPVYLGVTVLYLFNNLALYFDPVLKMDLFGPNFVFGGAPLPKYEVPPGV